MLTAACCNRLGLHCILVLKKRGVCDKKGNQLLDDLLGADVRFVDTDDYAGRVRGDGPDLPGIAPGGP